MITHESSLEDFSSQLQYVLDQYTNHQIDKSDIQNIILGGLGGSGIGAAIAKGYFYDKISLPIETVNDYHLPSYAGTKSLIVLNSYSGNTEETLTMYDEARACGAKMLVLSSGGAITENCKRDGIKCYPIQTGFQPRMTIGFGFSYLMLILSELNGQDLRSEITSVIERMNAEQANQIKSANTIFNYFKSSLKNKFVILADRQMMAIAIRFSQQINENAKLEAFVNAIPETNHNVLESYTDRMQTNFVFLYTEENPRISARFDFLIGHLEMDNNKVLPLAIPTYDLYTIYDVIYRLDWVSVMMANELGAPLMEVPIITELKEFLGNVEIVEKLDEEE